MNKIDFSEMIRTEKESIEKIQVCAFCGSKMSVSQSRPGICNSCRDAVMWAKKKMEAERTEKLNEKNRKEDETRWRKIMQGL